MDTDAAAIIERLALQRHPEGGWYRETYRAPGPEGRRGVATSILFLLEAGQASHWHRVDAAELWLHQAGGALVLSTAEGRAVTETHLGPDPFAGHVLQAAVAPRQWQAARALDRWALAACVVAPAFDFAGFELAPPGWSPDQA